jgi:iron uptake system component EfeO
VIDEKDPQLGPTLDQRFAAVDALLAKYREGDGYKSYLTLTEDDKKAMAAAVDALAEPISQVAGVVTS